ncbi:hypothetical protein DFH07DRAFT_786059, partial [Mycena maculata]
EEEEAVAKAKSSIGSDFYLLLEKTMMMSKIDVLSKYSKSTRSPEGSRVSVSELFYCGWNALCKRPAREAKYDADYDELLHLRNSSKREVARLTKELNQTKSDAQETCISLEAQIEVAEEARYQSELRAQNADQDLDALKQECKQREMIIQNGEKTRHEKERVINELEQKLEDKERFDHKDALKHHEEIAEDLKKKNEGLRQQHTTLQGQLEESEASLTLSQERLNEVAKEEKRKHETAQKNADGAIAQLREHLQRIQEEASAEKSRFEEAEGWLKLAMSAGERDHKQAQATITRLKIDAENAEKDWAHADRNLKVKVEELESAITGLQTELQWARTEKEIATQKAKESAAQLETEKVISEMHFVGSFLFVDPDGFPDTATRGLSSRRKGCLRENSCLPRPLTTQQDQSQSTIAQLKTRLEELETEKEIATQKAEESVARLEAEKSDMESRTRQFETSLQAEKEIVTKKAEESAARLETEKVISEMHFVGSFLFVDPDGFPDTATRGLSSRRKGCLRENSCLPRPLTTQQDQSQSTIAQLKTKLEELETEKEIATQKAKESVARLEAEKSDMESRTRQFETSLQAEKEIVTQKAEESAARLETEKIQMVSELERAESFETDVINLVHALFYGISGLESQEHFSSSFISVWADKETERAVIILKDLNSAHATELQSLADGLLGQIHEAIYHIEQQDAQLEEQYVKNRALEGQLIAQIQGNEAPTLRDEIVQLRKLITEARNQIQDLLDQKHELTYHVEQQDTQLEEQYVKNRALEGQLIAQIQGNEAPTLRDEIVQLRKLITEARNQIQDLLDQKHELTYHVEQQDTQLEEQYVKNRDLEGRLIAQIEENEAPSLRDEIVQLRSEHDTLHAKMMRLQGDHRKTIEDNAKKREAEVERHSEEQINARTEIHRLDKKLKQLEKELETARAEADDRLANNLVVLSSVHALGMQEGLDQGSVLARRDSVKLKRWGCLDELGVFLCYIAQKAAGATYIARSYEPASFPGLGDQTFEII